MVFVVLTPVGCLWGRLAVALLRLRWPFEGKKGGKKRDLGSHSGFSRSFVCSGAAAPRLTVPRPSAGSGAVLAAQLGTGWWWLQPVLQGKWEHFQGRSCCPQAGTSQPVVALEALWYRHP